MLFRIAIKGGFGGEAIEGVYINCSCLASKVVFALSCNLKIYVFPSLVKIASSLFVCRIWVVVIGKLGSR